MTPVAVIDVGDHGFESAARAALSAGPVIVGRGHGAPPREQEPLLRALTCTLVDGAGNVDLPPTCIAVDDVDAGIASLRGQVEEHPIAATTLCQLLRLTVHLPTAEALVAESLAYSTLLAGPEFAAWLARRPPREPSVDDEPPVVIERDRAGLDIRLNRPARHNAYSAQMRDALIEALEIAVYDDSVQSVVLRGNGSSFCSGGDLDEFGTTPDAATAHLIRMQRSVASLLARLSGRLEVRVHGACIGAGTEFAAFGGTVVAADDAYFQLPELAMGLVPGAGGTASVCARVGRWRTAYLALTGNRIDVDTALAWRLVDKRADD